MTSSEKKSGRPTLRAAAMMTSTRSAPAGSRPCSSRKWSSCLCAFSTMMIAASTIAPMAMAIPPSDMMFEVRPSARIGMNESRIAIGSVMIATSAERTCQRKTRQTKATTMLSSMSFSRSVAMAALDQFAPVIGGHDLHARAAATGATSFSFCLMPSITVSAFSP